jgi:tetratricopeptide (TPR) repeat protein/class 3 adenylate cyclase
MVVGMGANPALLSLVPRQAIRMVLDGPVPRAEPIGGAVLVLGLTGLTPPAGGGEEWGRLLDARLAPLIEHVSAYGGDVARIGGDGLRALFPGSPKTAARRAAQCALDAVAGSPAAVRAGLAAGRTLQAVVGDPGVRLEYLVAGPPVDRAAEAVRDADAGELLASDELADESYGMEVIRRSGQLWQVGRLRRRVRHPVAGPPAANGELAVERLSAFLHPYVAERLRASGRRLPGGHRDVTVAVAGLPGVDVEDVQAVERLKAMAADAVRTVDRHGGHLAGLDVGGRRCQVVACFGAPVGHEDDAERAIDCCLALSDLGGGLLGAGIATGPAYCGEVGSDARRVYAIVGEVVELATGLAGEAPPAGVLLDRATRSALGRAQRAEPPLRDPSFDQPLLGREVELRACEQLVRAALGGSGQVLAISGEAGIGKSRLGGEVVRVAQRLGFAVHGGACRRNGQTTAYLPWRSAWRTLLGIDVARPLEEQQAQLAAIANRDGWVERAPLIAPVLNLPLPDSELTASVEPSTRAELLRSLLLDLLRTAAAAAPVLLVVEDCHWIDTASLALLEFLASNVAGLPVLVLVTFRPGSGAGTLAWLQSVPHATELRLGALRPVDAESLVGRRIQMLRGEDAGAWWRTIGHVVTQAGGNPLYLEELANYLLAKAAPERTRAPDTAHLPDSLRRLVLARIDELDAGDKAVLQVASVIGQRFPVRWVWGSYPEVGTAEQVRHHLGHLVEHDLVHLRSASPEAQYAFKHAVTREVVYGSLSRQAREAAHERVGSFVEHAYPDRLAQFADLLAHHFGRSHNRAKQQVWLRAAGDAAKAAFANESAISYYERLLRLLPAESTAEVLVDLGDVLSAAARWAEGERRYRDAVQVAESTGDRRALATAKRGLGSLLPYVRSYPEAIDQLTEAAGGFQQLGDQAGLARTLDKLATTLWLQGAYEEAWEVAEHHLEIASEADDSAGMSAAFANLGVVAWRKGDHAEALVLLRQSLDAATRAGDAVGVIRADNNLGGLLGERGEHLEAIGHFQHALAAAEAIGDRVDAAIVIGNAGEVHRWQGEHARALACFVHAFRIAVELGDPTSLAIRAGSLAMTLAGQGRNHEAGQLFSRAVTLARILHTQYFLGEWLYHLARLLVSEGQLDRARRTNQEALEIAVRHGDRAVELQTALLAVELEVASGHLGREGAVRRLRVMQDTWVERPEQAMILDAIWQLDPSQEAARETAATLYRRLYERAPRVEYREAYRQLTGVALTPPAPLPPLPQTVGREPLDVAEALRRLDLAIARVQAG